MEIIQVDGVKDSLISRVMEFYRRRANNYKDMISMQRMLSGIVDYIIAKNDPYVLANSEILVRDTDHSYLCIYCGRGDRQFIVYETYPHHGKVEIVETIYKKFIDDIINTPEITKDIIENAVMRYCGVAGTNGGKKKESLRKHLIAAKETLEIAPDKNCWKNATLKVTDAFVNTVTFLSGTGKYKFSVNDVDGETNIVYDVSNETLVHTKDKDKACPWVCHIM
ncbi:Hypothetical predicted protein [Mytilus galloprovincialis]|uniref:Uncharacterized protein n=1 Tax=Mytilus galloprovincialis TaxID=29158 RepID=A0A8B6FS48_MYTGA|nr:Hypothetical predicted protein [Mytilus galloprovincialis]